MRMVQNIGLCDEAQKYLEENVVIIPEQFCPHCNEPISFKKKVVSVIKDDDYQFTNPDLHTYELKDGSNVSEVIQCQPWNSGPMTFLCLERDGVKFAMWTGKEINEYI